MHLKNLPVFPLWLLSTLALLVSAPGLGAAPSKFERVSEAELKNRGIADPKLFGEAWRDPSGTIWGDIAKERDGTPLILSQHDAVKHCEDLTADLPSGYPEDLNGIRGFPDRDSDFVSLRKHLGAQPAWANREPVGYVAKILPGFKFVEDGEVKSAWFWSSSVHPDRPEYAYYFHGLKGFISFDGRDFGDYYYSVRCILSGRN